MSILAKAKANYSKSSEGHRNASLQGKLPPQGSRWDYYTQKQDRLIGRITSPQQAIWHAQHSINFDHRSYASLALKARYLDSLLYRLSGKAKLFKKLRNLLHLSHASQISKDKHFLNYEFPCFSSYIENASETPYSDLASLVHIGDNLVSNILYFHLRALLHIIKWQPDSLDICEIGGGYGDTARIWLSEDQFNGRSYTIIDLPGSLFFAEIFIGLTVPNATIIYCNSVNDLPSSTRTNKTVYLIPIHQHFLSAELDFDFIFNTGSMGELDPGWVDFWCSWLDNQQSDLFYSCNLFGNPVNNLYEGQNLIAPVMSNNWSLLDATIDSSILLSQSVLRHFADEVFCKKDSKLIDHVKPGFPAQHSEFPQLFRKMNLNIFHMFVRLFLEYPPSCSQLLYFAEKTESDMEYVPKELLYLLQVFINNSSDCPDSFDISFQRLISLKDKLEKSFKGGVQGIGLI